jgi:hypothetical protein
MKKKVVIVLILFLVASSVYSQDPPIDASEVWNTNPDEGKLVMIGSMVLGFQLGILNATEVLSGYYYSGDSQMSEETFNMLGYIYHTQIQIIDDESYSYWVKLVDAYYTRDENKYSPYNLVFQKVWKDYFSNRTFE